MGCFNSNLWHFDASLYKFYSMDLFDFFPYIWLFGFFVCKIYKVFYFASFEFDHRRCHDFDTELP